MKLVSGKTQGHLQVEFIVYQPSTLSDTVYTQYKCPSVEIRHAIILTIDGRKIHSDLQFTSTVQLPLRLIAELLQHLKYF